MTNLYDKARPSVMIARILLLSINDFFTKRVLILSLVPALFVILFWSVVFLFFHTHISEISSHLIAYIPFATADWIKSIASMVLMILFFYQLVLMTIILSLGLISEKIVLAINEEHYSLKLEGDHSLSGVLTTSLKTNTIFLLLYILLLPTFFIPGINVAVHLFLWSILLKQPLLYDSAAIFANRDEYEHLLHANRWSLRVLSVLLSVLFFVPPIGAFTTIFQLIVLTHYSLARLKQSRVESGKHAGS